MVVECEKLVAQTIGREHVCLGSWWRLGDVLLITPTQEQALADGSSLGIINHLFVQDVECGMAMSIQILGEAQRGPLERRISLSKVEFIS